MAVSMKKVRTFLEQDEPEYDEAAKLGAEAVPHLAKVVQGDDAMLASKAAYLAGLIDSDKSPSVLERAAESEEPTVRVAAASAVRHLSEGPPELFDRLLSDDDAGVRKTALKSVSASQPRGVKPKVEELASGDPAEHVRELASDTARRLRK